jgi:hypothetical protein
MKNHKKIFSTLFYLLLLFATTNSCKKDKEDATSHCSNGIKDSDETGVDCGGSCPACAPAAVINCGDTLLTNKWWNPVSCSTVSFYFNSNGVYDNGFATGTWQCIGNDSIKVDQIGLTSYIYISRITKDTLVWGPPGNNCVYTH